MSDGHEFIFNGRGIDWGVHVFDVCTSSFNFGPFVQFEAKVLFNDIGMGVAESDAFVFSANDINLIIVGHQNYAASFITD